MKSRIGVLAGVVIVLAGLVGALTVVPALSAARDRGRATVLLGADNDTSTPFNLVDIAALARHTFHGNDLRLGPVVLTGRAWVRHAISYRSDGLRITGTLTLPRHGKPAPVVVALHGYRPPGDYTLGSGLLRKEKRLADAGFVVLHPDYRNFAGSSREGGRPVAHPLGYPDDAINAILALRAARLPHVDANRVGLLGRSMGGGVALDVAVARPDLVDALLLYSPVSSTAAENYRRWVLRDPSLRRRVTAAFGTPTSRPGLWREMSASSYLSRIDVPVQIDHGTADPVCPERWSAATAAALRAAGKQVQLFTYPGEVHRFNKLWPLFMNRAVAYFDQRLR